MMDQLLDRAFLWFPLVGAAILALAAMVTMLNSSPGGFLAELDQALVYGAIFDWSAIQTGFLFAAFGYLISNSTKFLTFISEMGLIQQMLRFVLESTIYGFALTFTSLVFLVWSPDPHGSSITVSLFIAAWVLLTTVAMLSFFRVIVIFGLIAVNAMNEGDRP